MIFYELGNYELSWSKSFWHRCKVLSCIWTIDVENVLRLWSELWRNEFLMTTFQLWQQHLHRKKNPQRWLQLCCTPWIPPFRFLSNSALDANLMAIICFTEKGFFHYKNEKKIWKLKVTCGFFSKWSIFVKCFSLEKHI